MILYIYIYIYIYIRIYNYIIKNKYNIYAECERELSNNVTACVA